MLRDRSTLTLGILLPLMLLLLFGFGLSLDVKLVPVAVVRDNSSPVTRDLFTALQRSAYFSPVLAGSWEEGRALLSSGDVDAIVRRQIRENPEGGETVQVVVNGRDSNTARIMQRYLEGALSQWTAARQSGTSFLHAPAAASSGKGQAEAVTRIWYNHASESSYFLVPGVTALIMTLIGSLLTALVVAREWERGTYEALAATPVHRAEIVAGKTVPYFCLGMVGLSLCLAAASWIFGVPMRGPLWLVVLTSLIYLLDALGMGLLISALTKNQFLASQIVLVVSFLPTMMLSGFIFDLKSAPEPVTYVAHVFPATWYVEILQTLFLVGSVPGIVVRNMLIMLLMAVLLLGLAGLSIRKSLE